MLKRILTALGYIFATVFVIGLTATLVAYGSGYSYSFKKGQIVRTGLVIMQSTPSGAAVSVDGKNLKKRTPYRFSREAGQYTVSLTRDGYNGWQKSLSVIASEVTTAQYAYLIPNNPAVRQIDERPSYQLEALSQDHRRLAFVAGGDQPAVYTLDLTDVNATPARLYVPVAATATTPAETVAGLLWSNDGSRLLVESTDAGVVTHRLFQYGSTAAPVNLTTQYGFNFSGARFAESNPRVLYWLSPDGLRRLDTGSQAVSGVLAANTTQFQIASRDRVVYVQSGTAGKSLWSLADNGDRQQLIAALPDAPSYSIDTATYNNGDQLAIVPSSTGTGTLYDDVYGDAPTSRVVARDVTVASFSPDGHLLVFSGPGQMRTYDLERSQVDNRPIAYDFPANGTVQTWTWFDNFHVLMTRNGRLIWSEFDGANQVDLGAAVANLPGYGAPNLRSVLAYRPAADGTVRLTRIITRP